MNLTSEQEEARRRGLELVARVEVWEAAHPEEARAYWESIERALAEHDACDHEWRPDERDPRYERCARCGWEAFSPNANKG